MVGGGRALKYSVKKVLTSGAYVLLRHKTRIYSPQRCLALEPCPGGDKHAPLVSLAPAASIAAVCFSYHSQVCSYLLAHMCDLAISLFLKTSGFFGGGYRELFIAPIFVNLHFKVFSLYIQWILDI